MQPILAIIHVTIILNIRKWIAEMIPIIIKIADKVSE